MLKQWRRNFGGGNLSAAWIPACAGMTGIGRALEGVKLCLCFLVFFPVDRRNVFFGAPRLNMDALWVPLRGAEQRRRTGGRRLALSEPQASSGKPPGAPSSARNPEGAPTLGSPFLWLLSFGEAKESTPASKAEPPANSAEPQAHSTEPQKSERKTSPTFLQHIPQPLRRRLQRHPHRRPRPLFGGHQPAKPTPQPGHCPIPER